MALATDHLTTHFTYGELRAHIAPVQYFPALLRTAQYLEIIRSILGVRLIRVSGWRSPERNEAVGGSRSSSHLVGEASDFTPEGMNLFTAWRKLRAAKDAGRLPPFDQFIFYPIDGHIHIGLGPQMRREWKIRVSESNYAPLTPDLLAKLPGYGTEPPTPTTTANTIAIFAVAFVALAIIFAINA